MMSTEKKPFVNNVHLVDSGTNSPFNHAELLFRQHVYDFEEIKLESLGGETNNPADIKDPFEGIVPESGFVSENSATLKTFICGTCETNFDDYNQLDEHCRNHICSKSFRFCPDEFVSKVSLNTNSYIHVKILFKCRYCVEVFPDQFKLKVHERIHKEDTMTMKRHESIHAVIKHFKCKFWGESFSRKSRMELHDRIHTKENPFTCGYCDKTFRDSSNMKRHERIHTGEKPFKCGYCNKTFGDRSCWKSHERIHSEEKQFKCGYCDKTFRDRGQMNRHERIHTLEKLIKCEYCDKTFRSRSTMKMHEHIHNKEKSFKCKFCEKSFSRRQYLLKHEHIHTREKPF